MCRIGAGMGAEAQKFCGYTSDGDRVDLEAFTTLLLELLTIGLTTNSDNFDSFLGKIWIFFSRNKLCFIPEIFGFFC